MIDLHSNEKIDSIRNNLANIGIEISKIVEKLTIRDWKRNLDIQKKMENGIEDYLIEHRNTLDIEITFDEIDEILKKCIKVAKSNY